MRIVFLGLSITSSWGNGHATTYRSLVRALDRLGHDIVFLERDVPWYAPNRDLPHADFCETVLYKDLDSLSQWRETIRDADAVVVGSFVPDGDKVGDFVLDNAQGAVLFYDIDTPITLDALAEGSCKYLRSDQVPRYGAYLSFTGGDVLRVLEETHGAQRAVPLYCSVDPDRHHPIAGATPDYDLGYLGTYSDDRQPGLERLLVGPADRWTEGRFVVAGPQYPKTIRWPSNVDRLEHVSPKDHSAFYGDQRFTLNLTRGSMVTAGWSPSVRLFEAAACGVPILSDEWAGLDRFFRPGKEIRIVRDADDVIDILLVLTDEERRQQAAAARRRVLAEHTSTHRARELVTTIRDVLDEEGPSGGATKGRSDDYMVGRGAGVRA